MKNRIINFKGSAVTVATRHEQDYISLTDMVKHFDGGSALIEQWLKNKDTVLFLGVWEQLNNPSFNSPEFEGIKNEAGRNSFFLSAKKWSDATGAIGLHAKAGRYGGTFAHKDIAFEFGSWLSPEFKLYLIKEFQRLKNEESRATSLEWNFQRTLEAIVEAFSSMQDDLDKERKVIMKQWAKPQEQIERVMGATVGMYGDLQGIAGKSLQEMEGLELSALEMKL